MKWNGTGLADGYGYGHGGIGMKKLTALILALALALSMLGAVAEDSDAGLTLSESVQAADEAIIIEDEATDEDGMDIELAEDAIFDEDALVVDGLSLDGLAELESVTEVPASSTDMQGNADDDSYTVLFKENCNYKVIQAFNWHTGPSVDTPTVGRMEAGRGFWSEAVIWNKKTNNMWLKKKDEEKYVFAGLHYANGQWYVDNTQTQYLQLYAIQGGYPSWVGCNLSGAALKQGNSFALQGCLESDTTMKSVMGEFYKGESCWGNPTDQFTIYSDKYSIYGSALDMALKFGALSAGEYSLRLTVTVLYDRGQTERIRHITVPFTISEAPVSDTIPPIIYDVTVSNVSMNGYTVSCGISDNVGVTSVKFPTWTEQNDQDDLIWHEGQLSGGRANYTVQTSDHRNENGCVYFTHIYAYDAAGNSSCEAIRVEVPPQDLTAPNIKDVSVSNITSEGFTVSCIVTDDVGVTSVKFPTWTEKNGQDDIIWYDGVLSGNKATLNVNVSNHNFERGCVYITHIYAYDAAGNNSCFGTSAFVPLQTVLPTSITLSKNTLQMALGSTYTLTATVFPENATDKTVSWFSTNTNVVIVNDGVVTAVSTGEAIITAKTVNGLSASCAITIKAASHTEEPEISLSKCKITVKNQVYTGKTIKPSVTVKYGSKTLKKGTDYTVSFKNNKAIGTATVTVTGKGDYTGTAKKTFKINPRAISGLKLTAGKGRLTVSWKKGAGGIGGYQLQYGLKKSFSGAKKATVSKASTVKGTIKNLKKGKIYYVRIRAFKKVGKTTYWSAWSAAKKAKVK